MLNDLSLDDVLFLELCVTYYHTVGITTTTTTTTTTVYYYYYYYY